MGQPFNDAQAQASDSGFGYQPAPPSADMSGAGAPPAYAPGSMAPAPTPKFYSGSTDELGMLRDGIMSQFPSVNDMDEPEGFTWGERMGLMGMAMVNPNGALDLIRQKRERQMKKRERAAQFNMKAIELAAHVMDAQNNLSLGVATLNQRAAEAKMEDDHAKVNQATNQGLLRVQEGQLNRQRQEDERAAQGQQMGTDLLSQGTDETGEGVSAPYGTPGFTSRAQSMGLTPSFDEHGASVAAPRVGTQKAEKNVAQLAEQLLAGGHARTPARAYQMAQKIVEMRSGAPSIGEGVVGGAGAPSMDPSKLPLP